MPNHVTTNMTLIGTDEDISKCVNTIIVNGEFDFNTIEPMPTELNGTRSPACILTDERYEELDENEKLCSYISETIDKDWLAKYGVNNWYDWAITKWGTKWGAYDTVTDEGSSYITFQTAWSFPEPLMLKLSEQFPTIEFECEFADGDIGSNCGEVTFKAGEEIRYINQDGADMFAMEVIYGDEAQSVYDEWQKENEEGEE